MYRPTYYVVVHVLNAYIEYCRSYHLRNFVVEINSIQNKNIPVQWQEGNIQLQHGDAVLANYWKAVKYIDKIAHNPLPR